MLEVICQLLMIEMWYDIILLQQMNQRYYLPSLSILVWKRQTVKRPIITLFNRESWVQQMFMNLERQVSISSSSRRVWKISTFSNPIMHNITSQVSSMFWSLWILETRYFKVFRKDSKKASSVDIVFLFLTKFLKAMRRLTPTYSHNPSLNTISKRLEVQKSLSICFFGFLILPINPRTLFNLAGCAINSFTSWNLVN